MLLFHKHGVRAKEALRWCEGNEFALQASPKVGQNTTEGMWLLKRHDKLNQLGQEWSDLSHVWYECARACINSVDIQGIGPDIKWRHLKQTCYIAFGIFLQRGSIDDPEWARDGIDIWYVFGFVTCDTIRGKSP